MSVPVSPVSDPAKTPAPSAAPRSSGDSVEVQSQVELVKMAFGELQPATLASGAVAIAFAIALSIEITSAFLWPWLVAMLIASGYRLWLANAFRLASPPPDKITGWARRYTTATLITGIGWGASVWLFPTFTRSPSLGLLHVLVLAGLTVGSSRLLLPMRRGSLAYLLVIMLPLTARFFVNGEPIDFILGGCVIAFVIYMAGAIRRSHQTIADALRLRFEREALTAQLQAQNANREAREAELREARERAETASRAKGDFLATISHEIRTPMNGVLGMLRIVRETPLTPEQRDYLKTASDSAETLLLLLNDVLDFSKIEAGRLELQCAPFPPAGTARAVADIMHTRARDKGLQFNLQFDDNLPSAIIGDAARVRQILTALLGNAIKFTERGRVDLAVTCVERADSRAVLHFTVSDTGIGIDSASLDRLFKPFSQADTSLGRRYGGTGLGLAISVRLAQAMGGLLQVQSTLNKGTTFRLILPAQLPEAVTHHPFEETPRFVTPTLKGRVLVVEDDSVNRQVMELFLKKMRVSPKFAHDGEEAIKLAAAETFDVILMDCQLPGIDGLETTRRIRQKLVGGRPVKIIALTANVGRSIREACLAAGMDDFLTKPVRLELLVEALERNLPKT
jgi:two-component system, sensor histidine kinase